jgi:hypothetical protein
MKKNVNKMTSKNVNKLKANMHCLIYNIKHL